MPFRRVAHSSRVIRPLSHRNGDPGRPGLSDYRQQKGPLRASFEVRSGNHLSFESMASPHFLEGTRASLLSLSSTVAVIASGLASAADIRWSATTGNFTVPGNWTGGVVPSDGDNAVINNGGTAQIEESLTLSGIHTGSTAGGGNYEQSAGDLGLLGALRLGIATSSNGSYFLSGGTITQEDGNFTIADGIGSTASFSIEQGTSVTRGSGALTVGRLGIGTLSIAGNLTSNGEFIVGDRTIAGSSSTGEVTQASGTFMNNADILIGLGDQQQGVNGNAGHYDLSGGMILANSGVLVGTGGAIGLLKIGNAFINKSPASQFVVGEGDGAEGTINQTSGFINCGSDFVLGKGEGATGTFTMEGSPPSSPAMVVGNSFVIGSEGGAGVLDIKGGTITKTPGPNVSNFVFADGNDSTATISVSGGRLTNVGGETWLGASGTGEGTWTISGTGECVTILLELGHADSAKGTLNLNTGGTLIANRITQGASTAASTINLDGGTLRANISSTAFMDGISAVIVEDGGVTIDTNAHDIAIAQTLANGGGGLTKNGDGKLALDGASNYAGETLIQKGTLALNGTLPSSPVTVGPSGTLAGQGTIGGSVTALGTISPGDDGGSLKVSGNLEFLGGTLKPVFSEAVVSPLVVTGQLSIENAGLDLTGVTLEAGSYTIATFGSVVGEEFVEVTGLPAGFTVAVTATAITISGAPVAPGYEAWATANELEGDDALADADPDKDGIANAIEFVIGGDPNLPGDVSKLPAGKVENGKLVFTYRRMDESADSAPFVQYGSTLGGWTEAEDGIDGVTISVEENAFEGGDLVTVSIPMLATPRFARLTMDLP